MKYLKVSLILMFFFSCAEVLDPVIYEIDLPEEEVVDEVDHIRAFLEEKIRREREYDISTSSQQNSLISIENLTQYIRIALANGHDDLVPIFQEFIQMYESILSGENIDQDEQRIGRIAWEYGNIDMKYATIIDDPTNIDLYIDAFISDARNSDMDDYHPYWEYDLSGLDISIDSDGSRPPSSGSWENTGGYATACNGSETVVVLNPRWADSDWGVFRSGVSWNLYRIELIYHELGHTLFNYMHVNDNDGDGSPDTGHVEGDFDIMGYGNASNYQDFIGGVSRFFNPTLQNIYECGINGKKVVNQISCLK